MDVVSTGPLRVASRVWQPRAGAWAMTVVCKATFRLEPGLSPLAATQDAPAESDARWEGAGAGSLRGVDDLVPYKARADVLLVGHAFASPGQAARSVRARLVVGTVDKRVDVWCDRIFWQGERLLDGQPFTRMPLRWERAAGGPGTANPVGMRFDAAPDAHGAVPIPNLQPAGSKLSRRSDTFPPVGFGPIAPDWPGRAATLGAHAGRLWLGRWWERPVPADLDRAYFNAAPQDQQLATLEPDERILLEHLHAEHAVLETQLPGLRPVARMTAGGRAGEEIGLVADTLCIDTDRGVASVVWRGRVPLTHAAEEGRVTVAFEGDAAEDTVGTLALGSGGEPTGPALPFPAAAHPAAPSTTETVLGATAPAASLPFGPAKSRWAEFQPREAPPEEPVEAPADTGTVFGIKLQTHGALPTAWVAPALAPPAVAYPAPTSALEIVDEETPPAAPHRQVQETAPHEPAAVEAAPSPPPRSEPAPPKELPLGACAAVAASIARTPADEAKILEREELSADAWTDAERHWNELLVAESRRGKRELLGAYDAAYVARLEEERGPIQVAEYARLVVAGERGTSAEALADLGLPRGAMMRIERVWLRRVTVDPHLGAAVRRAIKAAREA